MKLYYEQEVIDAYMNQTTLKKEFLDYFQDKLMKYCQENYSGSNMVKNRIIY
jgi:hypothetical protein